MNVHIAPENPPAQNILIGVISLPGRSLLIPALPKPDIYRNRNYIRSFDSLHLSFVMLSCYRSQRKRVQNWE